jgi:hypothetical protein
MCLLDHVVPPGPVLLAGDDTVAERPGPKVFGKGRHRDGVRSTHSYRPYTNIPVINRKVTMDGRGRRPMTNRVTTISMAPDPVKTGVCDGPLDCQDG